MKDSKHVDDEGAAVSLRSFLTTAGPQLAGTTLGFLAAVALARMLSTAAFGEFSAAYGVMVMAAALAGLGLGQYITVPFRRAIASGEFETVRGLRRWVPWCIVLASAVTYALVFSAHVRFGQGSAVRVESFAAVLAMTPLIALTAYLVAAANTHGAAGRAMFLSVSGLQLLILAGLGAARLAGVSDFGVLAAAAVWAGASALVCLALWRLNLAVEHSAFKDGAMVTAWGTWARGTAPYFLSGGVNVFLVQAPFLVLGWVHADGEAAAMFAAADRLAQLLAVAGLAGTAIFQPVVADVIRECSRARYGALLRQWFLLVGITNAIGLAAILVFGETFLDLYGAEYADAYPLLAVVSSSIGLTMTVSIFLSVVQYAGGGRKVIIVSAAWTLAGVTAMIVLGDRWSAMGVAIAQGLTFIGMYLTFYVQSLALVRARLR